MSADSGATDQVAPSDHGDNGDEDARLLPPASPTDVSTFNYAPVAVVFGLALSTALWFAGGRTHFMVDAPAGDDVAETDELFQ